MMRNLPDRPVMKQILSDLSDEELEELMKAHRQKVRSDVDIEYAPEELRGEVFWRSQDRHANIMAQWTKWIGIATVVNVFAALVSSGATLYQILRSAGYFQ